MSERFTIEEGRFGPQLVLQSAWSEDVGEFMRDRGIRELYLNYARGFEGTNLSFVESLPQLEAFWIIHRTIDDVSPIHALGELRSLKVDTYCQTPIDFSRFPKLEHVYLEWRRGVTGLFDLPRLEELFLNKYPGASTDDFAGLDALRKLSLANSKVEDLRGLAALSGLLFLGLYRLKRLRSLEGLEELVSLETLEIQECTKLDSLAEVRHLENLRRLLFTDLGTVDSVDFLSRLSRLEEVYFYGTTKVVDGDLDPLTQLPSLEDVSFQNRRHYNHTREEFPST